jgi:plastocyanin
VRTRSSRSFAIVAVIVLTISTAACSSGGGSDAGSTCVDLSKDGATFSIRIEDFAFQPSCFTASASQGISVTNADGAVHSFTIHGTPVDVDIAAGETFNGEAVAGVVEPGTYDFVCTYHPEMKGTVTVVA